MNRTVLLTLAACICLGCSGNEVTIRNESQTTVQFQFRGEIHHLVSGDSSTIGDIPNGTFDYSTIYEVPEGVLPGSVTTKGDLGGAMSFYNWDTKFSLAYASVWESKVMRDSTCRKDSTGADTACSYRADTSWYFTISA